MNRIKLAVWGINDAIWHAIKNSFDPERVEIVLFIDSNEGKRGVYYKNIPIIAPVRDMLNNETVDFYLITALSAYEAIRRQLMEWGAAAELIQPFITDEICKYSLGMLDEINRNFIKEAYFEPEKRENLVDKYREKYAVYFRSQYSGCADWVNQGTLISHGCGGIVNGRKVECSNSKEAFDNMVESKFRLMECDVLRMKNGELFLEHDFWRFWEAREKGYSTMSLEDFLRRLNKHSEITCLVDVKWDTYEDYQYVIDGIEKMLPYIAEGEREKASLKTRIVMEVYDEETIKIANQNNYNMFFTQYRNPEWMDYLSIANLCCEYGIGAVGVDVRTVDERLIKICKNKEIKIFAYSTDCIEVYSKLRKQGVTGVFTNYLRPLVDL